MSKKKIPKGWSDYLPYGGTVEGTKLFPFKTPLKLEMQYIIPKEQRFTPACLIANRPNLKAVIDLTDTDARADRYYCPKDFIDANVEHLKLRITGGGMVPGKDKIKLFSDAVDRFLKKYSDDPDALIGVHCTHGLNRTGYFICMYMVTRMGFSPIEAIDKFQTARGYVMYRQNFLEEIKEPGRHTSGSQVPDYNKKNKTICSVGNYEYQNTWLEAKPNKKPFRGFTEADIRNGGRRERRQREDRGKGRWRNSDTEQNWRQGNQTPGFSRDADLVGENPPFGRDHVPVVDGSFPNDVGQFEPRDVFGRKRGPRPAEYVGNRAVPCPMGPEPKRITQTGHNFSPGTDFWPFPGNQRGHIPAGVEHVPQGGMESKHFGQERTQFSLEESQRMGYPPLRVFDVRDVEREFRQHSQGGDPLPFRESLGRQQIPFERVQGRRDEPPRETREWTNSRRNRRGGQRDREQRTRQETNVRDEMEYRSPLDEDGFQAVSYHRNKGHRGGRGGGRQQFRQ